MIYLVMGVSGCGKTTIGNLLAKALRLPFYDADDFHSGENIAKMRQGQPLNDEDRQQWLKILGRKLPEWERNGGAVLACSALKERYRQLLQTLPPGQIFWIYLCGTPDLLAERLQNRLDHFMQACLLPSQLETLEAPTYALTVDISATPKEIVQEILTRMEDKQNNAAFGFIGMGVMGRNLALNLAEKKVQVAIYNRHVPGKEEGVSQKILDENPDLSNLTAFDDLGKFTASLERPRKIFLMIMAGPAIYEQLAALLPFLEPGDVIMDGGNSWYKDSDRRTRELAGRGIHFLGTGVSGGEAGARNGPAIMPGGSFQGFEQVEKYLNLMAAKDKNGQPCCSFIGAGGSGHFIKMVHNGIEYAEMQLLAEIYSLMRYGLQMTPTEMITILKDWQITGPASFLLDLTIEILQVYEGDGLLLDKVLDQAAQKGTGAWSVNAALEVGAPFGIISEAVMARAISAQKPARVKASQLYHHQFLQLDADKENFLKNLKAAYQASRILNHEAGFSMMQQASSEFGYNLNLSEIARIWTNGCIIRSALMEQLAEIYRSENDLFLAPVIKKQLLQFQSGLGQVISVGLQHGFALPVLSASLNYFLSRITANSPANLLQAQRDAFGAHTFKKTDANPNQNFHASWKPNSGTELS